MIALVLGENDPAQILMSQFLVDGLRARGFQVEHILMDPPPKARNLLTGLQAERCLREKSPVMAAPLKPALVINLNSGLPAAKLAARYTQCKRLGYFFEGGTGRVLIYGKSLRYLEQQRTSEKYPIFHRTDLYRALLNEIEVSPLKETTRPIPSAKVFKIFCFFDGLQTADLRWALKGCVDQEGSLSGVSVVATDCPSLAVKASAFGVPVWFYHEYGGEMLECGPFSEGSQILQKPASSEELLQALAAKVLAAEEARVEGATLRRVEQGPLILWPGEDLTEEAFWDFLFRYSTWSLHLRGAEVSFASLVSRFSAFLLRCELKIHQRFFLHAHLQNLNHVQEQLESLLGQSRGSLSEKELFAWVRRTPFPSARAAAWFGLKNDLQSSQPKVSLFYQVRLFLTHMRVQRQLLTHCLAILEGENERIFSE